MKKFVLLAAIACGFSLTGNAATLKADMPIAECTCANNIEISMPEHITELYEMVFTCEGQGWSIPVVGNTKQEMLDAYFFYDSHLDC